MLNGIFSQTNLLEKGMDAAWKKNEVIANNIANNDTADFKASHVEFESVFRDILEGDSDSFFSTDGSDGSNSNLSQSGALIQEFKQNVSGSFGSSGSSMPTDQAITANIVQDGDMSQLNGNSVDLDSEMSELAQNSILYNTLSYSVSKELARIKTVLNEGR